MIRILFLIISSLGLLMALGTVLARNLVHAALFLVAFFFLVACMFVLLEAEFLAAMQVLVYIGAVAILFVFGIMLTRNIQGDETTSGHWFGKVLAGMVCVMLFVVLAVGIINESGTGVRPAWSSLQTRPVLDPDTDPRGAAVADMSRSIGRDLATRFMLPFEIAGLLLTAAVVGAIAVAMSDEQEKAAATPDGKKSVTSRINPPGSANGASTTRPTVVSSH